MEHHIHIASDKIRWHTNVHRTEEINMARMRAPTINYFVVAYSLQSGPFFAAITVVCVSMETNFSPNTKIPIKHKIPEIILNKKNREEDSK